MRLESNEMSVYMYMYSTADSDKAEMGGGNDHRQLIHVVYPFCRKKAKLCPLTAIAELWTSKKDACDQNYGCMTPNTMEPAVRVTTPRNVRIPESCVNAVRDPDPNSEILLLVRTLQRKQNSRSWQIESWQTDSSACSSAAGDSHNYVLKSSNACCLFGISLHGNIPDRLAFSIALLMKWCVMITVGGEIRHKNVQLIWKVDFSWASLSPVGFDSICE